MSIEDYLRASTNYVTCGTWSGSLKMEAGTVALNDRLPGGIWAEEARRLVAVADLLGCSIDYLLGRTDEVNPRKMCPIWAPDGGRANRMNPASMPRLEPFSVPLIRFWNAGNGMEHNGVSPVLPGLLSQPLMFRCITGFQSV